MISSSFNSACCCCRLLVFSSTGGTCLSWDAGSFPFLWFNPSWVRSICCQSTSSTLSLFVVIFGRSDLGDLLIELLSSLIVLENCGIQILLHRILILAMHDYPILLLTINLSSASVVLLLLLLDISSLHHHLLGSGVRWFKLTILHRNCLVYI